MNALSSSIILSKTIPCSPLRPEAQFTVGTVPCNVSLSLRLSRSSSISQRSLTVRASFSDGRRSQNSNSFVGGFILGGLVVGTLGAIFAPQISNALAGADKKDLMRKLPKFIYDEEKALEKQRKKLSEKIAQLNFAIDEVSNQLHSEEDSPNGVVVKSDEHEIFA